MEAKIVYCIWVESNGYDPDILIAICTTKEKVEELKNRITSKYSIQETPLNLFIPFDEQR